MTLPNYPAETAGEWPSRLVQRLIHVGDEIRDIFNAYREAHKTVGYTARFPNLRGDRGMSHDRRMARQRLHTAQRLRKGKDLEALTKSNGRQTGRVRAVSA